MKIKEEHFIKIENDINGNPRYYLPDYWTRKEKNVREAGGIKYRGKKFGSGWIFSTYNLASICDMLNKLERAMPKGKLSVRWVSSRNVYQVYIGGKYITGCTGDTPEDALDELSYNYDLPILARSSANIVT